jgi:general secretion pathway protein G
LQAFLLFFRAWVVMRPARKKIYPVFPTIFGSHGVDFHESLSQLTYSISLMKIHTSSARRSRTAGFTLLEMVIVLGIIAMILGGAIFAMRGIGDAAKLRQVDSDFKSLDSALNMYKLNAGGFPTTQQGLKALVEKPTSTPVPKRHVPVMSKVPLDPWDSPYMYRFPGKKRANLFEIVSRGPDGMENTADDLSSQDE